MILLQKFSGNNVFDPLLKVSNNSVGEDFSYKEGVHPLIVYLLQVFSFSSNLYPEMHSKYSFKLNSNSVFVKIY